jgi:hypothetical protein
MDFKEFNQLVPEDEQSDFVMSFVAQSSEERDDMEEVWEETERNFLVRPLGESASSGATNDPLNNRGKSSLSSYSILKDPETHQEVMTIVSKIVAAVFPEGMFVRARPVGFEDALKADNVSKLLHYWHRLPGHYVTQIEWLMGSGIYGTSVLECYWDIRIEPRIVREITLDPFTGMELSLESVQPTAVFDDPCASVLDIRDVYPAPGCTRIENAYGVAKRFKITAMEAMRRAARGMYDKDAVIRAIQNAVSTDSKESEDKPSDSVRDLTPSKKISPDFVPLIGYEYYGETPFRVDSSDPKHPTEITSRRVITVLGNETVRSEIWPRRVPFFDHRIIPRLGSFWGIAPAELIRYDQDFVDVQKMMLADAVVRMTHPPHIYDKNADVDLAKLKMFRPSVPIGATRIDAIQQVPYNPPLGPAFSMHANTKTQMREATGALGSIQGLGLGVDRASATEAGQTFQQAMDRPEMYASIFEKNDLPPLAQYVLKLYQEILPENDPTEISRRIGESAYPVRLSDIMAEFDVEFIGSRMEGTKAQQLQTFREISNLGQNPVAQQLIPWVPLLRKWFNDLGAPDIAAMVGNPELMQLNLLLTQISGKSGMSGNGNGTTLSQPPTGLLPAQEAGGVGY